MPGEERSHVVFRVKYHRQRGTNQWKATTNEEPGIQALNVESVMEFADGQWEGQTEADEKQARIHVSIERDPRFFDLSPELEKARMAMTEKANQMADRELLKRHPGAEIEHDTGEKP
jgi:hypothetical protein